MFFSIGLGRGSPLNPIQLLWINLLTDVFPALALALEKPRPSIMTANPIPADRDLFDRDEKRSLLTQGLILTGAALLNYEYSRSRYQDPAHADSQAFFTLTVSQTLYTLTAMRDSRLHLNDVFNLERNQRWIQWSILASLLLIILGVRSRQVTTLLRNETLDSQDLVIGSLSSILSFWLDEMQKKTETGLADSIQPQQIGGPASQ
jgi:Ca2+-transporting ATPase